MSPNTVPTCVPNLKTTKTVGFGFTLNMKKIKRVKFLKFRFELHLKTCLGMTRVGGEGNRIGEGLIVS